MMGVRVLSGVALAAVLMLVGAAQASAAMRYAEPGGNGPAGSCPLADPCSFADAVEDASVQAGDQVILAAGTYVDNNGITVSKDIEVIGPLNGPPARFESEADPALWLLSTGSMVRDIQIFKTGDKGQAVLVSGGLLSRAEVDAPDAIACEVGSADPNNSVIRDSVCSSGGIAAVSITQDQPGNTFGVLEGVTAYSYGPGGSAIYSAGLGPGGQSSLIITDTIAEGGTVADVRSITDNAGGSLSTVTLANSAYGTVSEEGGGTATGIGAEPTNVHSDPLFIDAAGLNLRQATGSPTIDAGSSPVLGRPFDFEGNSRVLGGGADIGADEAVVLDRLISTVKKVKAGKKLKIKGACIQADCEAAGKAVVKLKGKPKAKKSVSVGPVSAIQRGTFVLKAKLPKKFAKKAKRKGGKVVLKLDIAEPLGNSGKLKKQLKLKKKKKK